MEYKIVKISRPWMVCIALAASPSQAQNVQTLDLHGYLEATMQYHLTQQEHSALARAESLNLREGYRHYWPAITARTAYEEVADQSDATRATPATRTFEGGMTTGLDTTWTSWIGTDVTLGLEHQYGRQLGKVSQGIPEEELQAHNISVEIDQPLLKHNTPYYNNLPRLRAQTEWQAYLAEGELSRLTVLRDAMLDFTAVQEAHDRYLIEQQKLELSRYVAELTATLANEGRSLPIDRDLAQLDALSQEQSVTDAQRVLQQSQRALTLSWVPDTHIEVTPLTSAASLLDQVMPVLNADPGASNHPAYRQRQLQLQTAQRTAQASRRDRWPDLSVYYRYEKNYRDVLPDTDSQAWGLRFSYALFDGPTREQRARQSAQATIARWNAEDQLAQLQWNTTRLTQNTRARLSELDLHDQGLELSQRALDQELIRYQEGLASYSDVQNRQQDLLDRQLSTLAIQVELATGLIELAYNRQWNWPNRLP